MPEDTCHLGVGVVGSWDILPLVLILNEPQFPEIQYSRNVFFLN